MLNTNREF